MSNQLETNVLFYLALQILNFPLGARIVVLLSQTLKFQEHDPQTFHPSAVVTKNT